MEVTATQTIIPNKLILSKKDSSVLKGLALILLLLHHLFYIQNGRYDDIQLYKGIYLVNMIGQISKICVAIFVLLSGYGLAATYNKNSFKLSGFFLRRFGKLFVNYWLIWLLFVPVGVIFFELSFDKVYGDHVAGKFLLDLTGLLNLTGSYGVNPTWWFLSCIILLYLLFPVIMIAFERQWSKILIFLISIVMIVWPGNLIFLGPIRYYLFAFLVGIYIYHLDTQTITPPLQQITNRAVNGSLTTIERHIFLSGLFLLLSFRFMLPYALGVDTIIALLIVIVYKNIKVHSGMLRFLNICGKHSFNIFLFHTFLFFLYIPDVIYWSRNPVVIFFTLLALCLPISWIVNKCHKVFRLDKIVSYRQI